MFCPSQFFVRAGQPLSLVHAGSFVHVSLGHFSGPFLWFDRAAGFSSPRPRNADANVGCAARSKCRGGKLFTRTGRSHHATRALPMKLDQHGRPEAAMRAIPSSKRYRTADDGYRWPCPEGRVLSCARPARHRPHEAGPRAGDHPLQFARSATGISDEESCHPKSRGRPSRPVLTMTRTWEYRVLRPERASHAPAAQDGRRRRGQR